MKQPNLIYFSLMFNDTGFEGGGLIAKALHKNVTLKYLRMIGNKFENKSGIFYLLQYYKLIHPERNGI